MTNQSPTPERVAAEVRAEMGRQRKTQADLARALGMHPATAARRLDGSIPFDVLELVGTADWLGISVAELVARAEGSSSAERVGA